MSLVGALAIDDRAFREGAAVQPLSVAWSGGEIASATPVAEAAATIALPGLVCAHVELGSAALPGFPGDARALLDRVDERALRALAMHGALGAARAGVTVLFDLWRGAFRDGALDVIAEACDAVGIRAVLAADAIDAAGARENLRFDARVKGGDRFRAAMGASKPLADAGTIAEARKREMPAHVVWSGDAGERRRAAEAGLLRAGSLVVLDSPLDDEERALLRDLATWVVTTPRADARLSRAAPSLEYTFSRVALGGAGAIADPLAELDAARAARPALDAARVFSLLARGWDIAADAFDLPFGRFAPGSPADLVILDARVPAPLVPRTMSAQVAHLSTNDIRTVVCGGVTIVRDARSTRVDEDEVRAHAREETRRIWAKAAA